MPFGCAMNERTIARALVSLALMTAAAGSSSAQTAKPDPALVQRPIPLTSAARASLAQWVLAHPAVQQSTPGHRLAAIRVTAADATDPAGKTRTIVTAVLFDHTALEARRITIDANSNGILSSERLPGAPQSSIEERGEAVAIVRRNAEFARLLDRGAVLDGGFIVADPAGSRRRMIQLKLMSADRHTLLRSITVDLTRQEMAATSIAAAAGARPAVGR
jgi:hypothetical protein